MFDLTEVCESLSSPASGQFSYSTNGVMTKATFLCDTYTTMAGTNVLSCQTNGSWDNPIPSCGKCWVQFVQVFISNNILGKHLRTVKTNINLVLFKYSDCPFMWSKLYPLIPSV